MPNCHASHPSRLSICLCAWLVLLILASVPSTVRADCCANNGVTMFQEFVFINLNPEEAKNADPVIDQIDTLAESYEFTDDEIINVVPNEQYVGDVGLKGLLLYFNTSCAFTPSTAFLTDNNLDNTTLSTIQTSPIIALIQRGGDCTFTTKIESAKMTASFAGLILAGVILYDNQTDLSITSRVSSSSAWNISTYPDNDIDSSIAALGNAQNFYWVPTVFIRNSFGLALHNFAFNGSVYRRPGSRDFVRIRMFNSSAAANTSGFWMSFLKNWVPGIVMAGVTMLLATLIFRLHRRYIRRLIQRRRIQACNLCMLAKDVLDTFVVRLYDVEAIKNQSCAICLDDFIEGESTVRALPCGHGFCVECIDPWLSTKAAQCPICKFDCSPPKPSATGEEGVVSEPTSTTTSRADEGVATIELAVLTSKPDTGVIWEQVGRLDVEARERERRSMLEERKGEASEQGK